ncbi:MAG: 30S ribosomal protein S2 [Patescibacteria group bacterium]|nr:30S ribosomal protein S2 [Patescibacteria group bacterium]
MPEDLTNEIVTEMAQSGVIFGHKKSRTHPRMKPFIGGIRNEIELIDPQATFDSLNKAIGFLKEKVKAGGLVLAVGTQAAAKDGVKEFASEFKFPYVIKRWLGGTMTNFKVITDRLKYYEDLRSKKERGELVKYTKKEQLEFSKEISKLSESFDGLANLKKIPDALFVVDIQVHETAVREAKKINIPVVAILDTDDNPDLVKYPIFANDHTKMSIEWVMKKVKSELRKEIPVN